MTDHSVTHATFSLERSYPLPPARVFAAWADPAAKARWFAGPDSGHELDFRVGGREVNHGTRQLARRTRQGARSRPSERRGATHLGHREF